MITLTADEKMLAILNQATGLAEIRDAGGKVVGFFAPIALPQAGRYANAAAHIDPTEIARRKSAKENGHTTREVFEHLLTLTKDEPLRADLHKHLEVLKERDRCDGLERGTRAR